MFFNGLTNSDARSDYNIFVRNVLGILEGDWSDGEVCSVVGQVDAEAFREPAWPFEVAGGADKDAARDAFGLGDDVEHEVDAVVEIDVGMGRGTEDDAGALGEASGGMGGGIVEGEVGFCLGDGGLKIAMNDDFAEQIAGDDGCGARKEVTI